MMLLSLHIVAIAAIIGIAWNIAYKMGKKEGLRIARFEKETSSPGKSTGQSAKPKFPSAISHISLINLIKK